MTNIITKRITKLTTIAMLTALAVALTAIIHFPIIPAAPFLEYDPADIPVLMGTFLFGPWIGLGLTVLVSVAQGLTVSAASGPIGIIMHILATGAFSVIAGTIYQKKHTYGGAILGLGLGVLAQTAIMCGCNLILTPIFLGSPVEEVVKLLLPAIIPFNLMKAVMNAALAYFLYRPVRSALSASRLLPKTEHPVASRAVSVGAVAVALVLIAGVVFCYIFVLNGSFQLFRA